MRMFIIAVVCYYGDYYHFPLWHSWYTIYGIGIVVSAFVAGLQDFAEIKSRFDI